MLNKILNFSLKNRLIIIVSAVLISISGLYFATRMEVDVFPDLTAPTVVVMTEAKGLAPEEVERLVTFHIETAVNGATGVRRVRSSSTTGFSVVWVEFEWGTDIYRARQIVNEKLSGIKGQLPESVGPPTLGPQSSLLGEVLLVSLTSDSISQLDLRALADWELRPRLLATSGVSQVAVIGGDVKQYQILLDANRMAYYKVTLNEAMQCVQNSNENASGGLLNQYGNEYIIRGVGRTTRLNEIGGNVVKCTDGAPIKLEDIAEIKIGSEPKIGMSSERGKPSVILTVTKQPHTNTTELLERLDAIIGQWEKTQVNNIHVSTDIYRQSTFIEAAIENVKRSLLEGSFFVIVVLFLFLLNYRTTVISLTAIPISLLVSVLCLRFFGFSINTMSLGGMAIAIGVLVDDAIIDVDNVFRRLKQNVGLAKKDRLGTIQVVFEASSEIRPSIINATFIIIVAFIPLFFLSGMEGRMLIPLGVAFIISLFASLIVAITLTPVMCSYMLSSRKMLKRQPKESWLVTYLNSAYEKMLLITLRKPPRVILSSVVLFAFSLIILFNLGRSFLPEFNEGSLVVITTTVPGISIEESDKLARAAERVLLSIPEIKTTARKTGRAELDEHALGSNTSEIEAPFELMNRSKDDFFADVRNRLSEIAGLNVIIGQPIGHRIDHMLSGTKANIAIKLFGSNLNQMFQIGNEIKSSISEIDGLKDINVEQQIEIPQLQIKPKREMLARYGVSIQQFSEFINIAFAGREVSTIYEGDMSFPLVVRFKDSDRNSIESIKNTLIDVGNGGGKIPLYFVANVVSTSGPNTISRENVQRKLVVSANVAERDLRSVVNDIQKSVNENVSLPQGYRVEYGGQFESEAAASRILLIASLFSVLIIFLILYQEFKELSTAAIILLNLPLALIGGVFSIWASSGIISIPAIIGFITLLGIATRNGILLIAQYKILLNNGKSLWDAIIKGSVERLSPILMTALTAALALVPMAINGNSPGNEIQSPMAIVILGGLLSSTLLNIFVIPAIFFVKKHKKN